LEVAVISVTNSSILNEIKKCNFILSTKDVKEKFDFLKIFDSAQNRFFKNYPSCFWVWSSSIFGIVELKNI
jgi:hypothetical protein